MFDSIDLEESFTTLDETGKNQATEIILLKEQIEKMKNCRNCQKFVRGKCISDPMCGPKDRNEWKISEA